MVNSETGWMPGVLRISNIEYGYADVPIDGMYPKAVIFHAMAGFRRTLDAWAASPEAEGVSVHFGVDRSGDIAQYVSIWNPAYHAGITNSPDGWGQHCMQQWGQNPNKWSIGVEGEGFSIDPRAYDYDYIYGLEGQLDPKGRIMHPWPEAMVQAFMNINAFVFASTEELVAATDKKDRILTHNQFDTVNRAQDPGDYWIATVKPRLQAALTPATPPTPIPVPQLDPRFIQARDLLTQAIIDNGGQ